MSLSLAGSLAHAAPPRTNLASFGAGAIVVKQPAAYDESWSGHTDSTGAADHNQQLSDKRAASVKAYLVKAGIAADRPTAKGFGSTKPVASNDTTLGRSQNRRVEIVKQ